MAVKVFLTDDSVDTLEALTLVYNYHPDFEVVGDARTVTATWESLRTSEIDIVSLDIQIGPDDGIRLCQQLRAEFPFLFIVVCSLDSDEAIQMQARQAGASYFLSKPFGTSELNQLLAAYQTFGQP